MIKTFLFITKSIFNRSMQLYHKDFKLLSRFRQTYLFIFLSRYICKRISGLYFSFGIYFCLLSIFPLPLFPVIIFCLQKCSSIFQIVGPTPATICVNACSGEFWLKKRHYKNIARIANAVQCHS